MAPHKLQFCPVCKSQLSWKTSGGLERLTCSKPECGYVFWNNPVPVVAAIVEHEGSIILVRNKTWPPKWYGLVTGYLEAGESPEEAVLREVEEELGLSGEVVELVSLYSFSEKNELILAYHVMGSGKVVIGEELADAKSVPVEKLKPWPFATGLAVRDWLKKRTEVADKP